MSTPFTPSPHSKAQCPADPFALFNTWFQDAVQAAIPLPEAITLATATDDGVPNARMVLHKGLSGGGFLFFTNYESRKASELEANPRAALVYHWRELERQIRVQGSVARVSTQESDDYFASRPRESQLGAWASQQSAEIPDRTWLEKRFAELEQQYDRKDVPRSPHWGGYRVIPLEIEFWQGQPGRLHDRFLYRRGSPAAPWVLSQLSP